MRSNALISSQLQFLKSNLLVGSIPKITTDLSVSELILVTLQPI